jgi:[ribulose-bisphosphate carboxylase]-lysine N-methyltransferase
MKLLFSSVLLLIPTGVVSFAINRHTQQSQYHATKSSSSSLSSSTSETLSANLESALEECKSELTKQCKVTMGPSTTTASEPGSTSSSSSRLGLIATSDIRKGEIILNMPYGMCELSAAMAREVVFKGILDENYEGWTGDAGLIALSLLNEVARASGGGGVALPKRPDAIQSFMEAWVMALPGPTEFDHPLLWAEDDQEVLQSSSRTKVYKALDDLEEDVNWLTENVFEKDRSTFPQTVTWNGQEIPCFNVQGYKWAMALSQSRTVFVNSASRLLPYLDMCNHEDDADEIVGGTMGRFGTIKGAQLVSSQKYRKGDEVFCSYGPKSAADYLLEHGFCPPRAWKTAVSEITLELDEKDRFYDDKLDILEFETYDQAPLDPVQSFDLVSAPGRDGEPDPAMVQFARLCKLGSTDAFLLESIFRKEVWEFMALPVSERNEFAVVEWIVESIEKALEDLKACPEGGPEVCTKLRESETKALTRSLEFLLREKEALDLKEYYQERRLKDLGLDSDWTPEDDMNNPDLGFGQTRAPGGADYDW